MFFNKKNPTTQNVTKATTSTSKSIPVSLEKHRVNLDKTIITIKEKTGINLEKHIAQVYIVLDNSGSMGPRYESGKVQAALTRLLPIALKFDDDGKANVIIFNTHCAKLKDMTLENYETYIDKQFFGKGHSAYGGTKYAPAIKEVLKACNSKSPYPIFVIFITDGNNEDKDETNTLIREYSNMPVFFQFVGIGNEKFKYLEKLDNLSGRKVDNTAFVKISDLSALTDEELYNNLLEQYPQWLNAIKNF